MDANSQVARTPRLPLLSAKIGAESLIGRPIIDPAGSAIGELADIVLDIASGRIAYAVIELDQRRYPDQLVVAPWNALFLDASTGRVRIRINVHAERIERAPVLQRGFAADRFAHHWAALIHAYFGTVPYWEESPSRQFC